MAMKNFLNYFCVLVTLVLNTGMIILELKAKEWLGKNYNPFFGAKTLILTKLVSAKLSSNDEEHVPKNGQ